MESSGGVTSGNAANDEACAGWFVGHFMAGDVGPRATETLEVKWAVYAGGEARAEWGANREATTLAVLVRGHFRLLFPDREVILRQEGDYALWEPGVPHHWRAEGPTIVLTVRWPSLPDDSFGVAVSGEIAPAVNPA